MADNKSIVSIPAIEGEIVKLIPADNRYAVSDHGRAWSCVTGFWKELKGSLVTGYPSIRLDSRIIRIHRLVLEMFGPPMPTHAKMVCRHIDGDPTNNNVSNLQWGTYQENTLDRHRHGWNRRISRKPKTRFSRPRMTEEQVSEIRRRWDARDTVRKMAMEFGVREESIKMAIYRKTFRDIQ